MEEIKATLQNEDEKIDGVIHLDNLTGPQGFSAYELYLKNLPPEATPMTETEWVDSIGKVNYYKKFSKIYTVPANWIGEIIKDETLSNNTTIVEIYVNGEKLVEGIDYKNMAYGPSIGIGGIQPGYEFFEFVNEYEEGSIIEIVYFKSIVATENDYDLLKGEKGDTPHIGDNGNWFIGNADTNVSALNTPLVDNLESDSVKYGLTAKQGKILNEKIEENATTLNEKIESNTTEIDELNDDILYLSMKTSDLEKEIANKHKYSTTEQKIGTWIDGKPIYRKAFEGEIGAGNATQVGTVYNVKSFISIYGSIAYDNGFHQLGAYANENFFSLVQWNNTGGVSVWCKTNSGYVGKKVVVVVEYTKTTD